MTELPNGISAGRILEGLRALRTTRSREDTGICWNLGEWLEIDLEHELKAITYRQIINMVAELALDWPLFSQNNDYPVPHPEVDPKGAFCLDDLWDPATVYGANRRDLLEHLITKFEEMVSHAPHH